MGYEKLYQITMRISHETRLGLDELAKRSGLSRAETARKLLEQTVVERLSPNLIIMGVDRESLTKERVSGDSQLTEGFGGVAEGETLTNHMRVSESPTIPSATIGTDRALLPSSFLAPKSFSPSKPSEESLGDPEIARASPDPETTPGYWLAREPWKRLKDPQSKLSKLMDTFPTGVDHLAEVKAVVQWWPERKNKRSWLVASAISRGLTKWWKRALNDLPLLNQAGPGGAKPIKRSAGIAIRHLKQRWKDSDQYWLKPQMPFEEWLPRWENGEF